jgi:mediator of RNA polymerase II transcription subunit 8
MAVHPSTNYPGRTHEPILGTLLRKKLEPDVEVLVEAARQAAISAGVDVSKIGKKRRRQDEDEEEEDEDEDGYQPEDDDGGDDPLANLWADVRVATTEKLKEFVSKEARHLFTAAEREMGVENVRTGLRRNLAEMDYDEDEEEEEEEEEEEGDEAEREDEDVDMDQGGAPLPVPGQTQPVVRETTDEELLWFMTRGETELPRGIETEATRNAANKARRGGLGGR